VEGIEDGESYLKKLKIRTRGGERFGVDAKHVRVSMIGTDDEFIELCTRLSNAKRE
jgi:L-tryptophan--pyruvate aminotransferase